MHVQHLAIQKARKLDDPVTILDGVGIRIEEKLNRLAIHAIQDLLFHLPLRYEDSLREIGNNRWDHSAWPNDDLPRE